MNVDGRGSIEWLWIPITAPRMLHTQKTCEVSLAMPLCSLVKLLRDIHSPRLFMSVRPCCQLRELDWTFIRHSSPSLIKVRHTKHGLFYRIAACAIYYCNRCTHHAVWARSRYRLHILPPFCRTPSGLSIKFGVACFGPCVELHVVLGRERHTEDCLALHPATRLSTLSIRLLPASVHWKRCLSRVALWDDESQSA